MSERLKIETAEDIGERTREFKDKLKSRRETGGQEDWSVGYGEYYELLAGDKWEDSEYPMEGKSDPEKVPIYGVERYLLDSAKELAERRRVTGEKKPVFLVDFGGVRSISFLRIAKELEKDGLISSGDIYLIVTNLNFDPNGEQLDINEERVTFFEKYKNLVHFINADAREFQRQEIDIGEKKISLKGNVDFIHENMALTHGTINDVDWVLLARMLASGGQLISKTAAEKGLHPSIENAKTEATRGRAHRLGIKNIQSMGLVKKDLGPKPNYVIFVKE